MGESEIRGNWINIFYLQIFRVDEVDMCTFYHFRKEIAAGSWSDYVVLTIVWLYLYAT